MKVNAFFEEKKVEKKQKASKKNKGALFKRASDGEVDVEQRARKLHKKHKSELPRTYT